LTSAYEDNITEVADDAYYEDLELQQQAAEQRWRTVKKTALIIFIFGALSMPFTASECNCSIMVPLLAWLNCAVYTFFAIYFLRQQTLNCLIPIIAPMIMVVGSALGVVFFAIFYPNEEYSTLIESTSFFAGGVRFQMVILLFLLSYLIPLKWMLRPERQVTESAQHFTKSIAYIAMIVYVPTIAFRVFVQIVPVSGIIKWFGEGMMIYCNGFMFIIGSVFPRLPKIFKMIVFATLGAILIVFTVASSRGKALFPIAYLLLGYLVFSSAKLKTKMIPVVIFMMALPLYTVLGETVRAITHTVGFEDFSGRLAALREWKYVFQKAGDPIRQMFGRFFFNGGNTVIASTPYQHPFLDFSLGRFTMETLESLLPGALVHNPFYRGVQILKEYGLNVSEKTSIEVSIIGHLWLLGGYIPVIIGGFTMSLIHGFAAWRIRAAWFKNPDKAMLYFAVLLQGFMDYFNVDIIENLRYTLWRLLFAFVLYHMISPLLKMGYRQASDQDLIEEFA
jgi:hypothetical protein